MSGLAERRAPPASAPVPGPQCLVDLMYDGLYALFLLKHGAGPLGGNDPHGENFVNHITAFLRDVERGAKALDIDPEDVLHAKYVYCAAVDEIILRSPFALRDAWETRPLQLRLFGDQLAGEHFFHRLEELRARGERHLQVLEVFHLCLLLGFQGRYALDGAEKLNYLCARLGEEIARMRGRNRAFAPHVERPDRITNRLRRHLSLWIVTGVCALIGLGVFAGMRASLDREAHLALAGYHDLVQLPPRAAHVTITLP